MSLSLPGKGSILQNTFLILNLPRITFAKVVESDVASNSFEDEKIGVTLGWDVELEIFDRKKTSSGSFSLRDEILVVDVYWFLV